MPHAEQCEFERLCEARRLGQPLAYLTGEREFYSRRFRVTPDVLIPRAESETLVRLALACAPPRARLLDLGTGSGALAITLALERPDLAVTGTDISAAALAVAADNATSLRAELRWRQGNWFEAIDQDEKFETILSNPPYIADTDEHLQQGDLRHEPAHALSSGPAGLDAITTITGAARAALVPGGWLLIEHGWQQAGQVRGLMRQTGFEQIRSETDDLGHERVTLGQSPTT